MDVHLLLGRKYENQSLIINNLGLSNSIVGDTNPIAKKLAIAAKPIEPAILEKF
jgi:hypothetical protein